MDDYTLSPREYEIAQLVAKDLSNKEIAARLGLSLQTVKNTLLTVQLKLGAYSRVGVAVIISTRPIIVQDMRGQGQQGRVR